MVSPPHHSPVVVVAGPTASGKSRVALAIAQAFDGVVINADSMQVYRELRILTARPSIRDEALVPHRLFGCLPAAERCSAGRWRDLALAEIAAARENRRLPIVVGGTGLYLGALTAGLAPIPEIPSDIRSATRRLYDRLGGPAFYDRLAVRDPVAANRLTPSDRTRLLRAWEVIEATGVPLSTWQEATGGGLAEPANAIVLTPPRDLLYRAIDTRFDAMMAAGAIAEVRQLLDLGLDPELPAMKALGVRDIAGYLAGATTIEAAATAAKQASRHYAKRQLTWLRHHKISRNSYSTQFPEKNLDEILSFIRQHGLTGQV